jgi:hypothetical protein
MSRLKALSEEIHPEVDRAKKNKKAQAFVLNKMAYPYKTYI